MSKMDDFFKKHYDNAEEATDGWNIPSDHIWDEASVHFPKPKKKRRLFPFFFFGGSVLALVVAAVYVWGGFNGGNISEQGRETTTEHSEIQNEEEIGLHNQISNNLNQDKNNLANGINRDLFVPSTSTQSNISDYHSSKENTLVTPVLSSNRAEIKNQSRKVKTSSQLLITGQIPEEDPSDVNQNMLNNPLSGSKSELNNQKLDVDILDVVGIIPIEQQNDTNVIVPTFKVEPKNRIGRTRELGISHALSVFSFGKYAQRDGLDEVDFTPKYFNINLHYNKWIGNRWSLSTGIYISDIDAKLDFKGFFHYDQIGTSNQAINSEVEKALAQGTINQVSNAQVSFLPGFGPRIGDFLSVEGVANIKLAAVQLPIMVNYHWIKPKVEYSIGVGGVFDFVWEEQYSVDFDIFREMTKISDEVEVSDFSAANFDYSLFIQPSFKYKVSPRFNLGVNLRYSVLEPIFSGLEIGAYYRWNR